MMWCANLAYTLKDCYGMFEISDVEHRDNELYVRVVANTVNRAETASLTKRAFVGGSLDGRLVGGNRVRNERKAPDACPGRRP